MSQGDALDLQPLRRRPACVLSLDVVAFSRMMSQNDLAAVNAVRVCRGIVGTLVQVGQGKIPASEIPKILEHKDRRMAGMTAPAHGLVLWKVFYGRGSRHSGTDSEGRSGTGTRKGKGSDE